MSDMTIPILYEDKDTLVIDKPSGLLSELSETAPSAVKEMLAHVGGGFLSPITRLDREVSGVMLLAKNKKSAAYYTAMIAEREEIKKEYLAVAEGHIDPASGEMHDLLFKDSAKNKSYVVSRMRRGVKDASLSYTVLGEREEKEKHLSLVRVLLHTGRTHQIRVQLSSRRHPLVGDRKYGGAPDFPMGLLAYRLSFRLPSGKRITCTSTLWQEAPFAAFSALFAEDAAP